MALSRRQESLSKGLSIFACDWSVYRCPLRVIDDAIEATETLHGKIHQGFAVR